MNWIVIALLAAFAICAGIAVWYGLPNPFEF